MFEDTFMGETWKEWALFIVFVLVILGITHYVLDVVMEA